jgi:hypothetical protein
VIFTVAELPTTVKSLSGGSDRSTLLYSGLFFLCGVVGVIYSGYSSDRSGGRKWHCIAGQVLTGLLLAASTISGQPFALVMVWFFLTGLVISSWPPPFWALPTITLTSSVAAASIGFINMFANLWDCGSRLYAQPVMRKWRKHTGARCLFFTFQNRSEPVIEGKISACSGRSAASIQSRSRHRPVSARGPVHS